MISNPSGHEPVLGKKAPYMTRPKVVDASYFPDYDTLAHGVAIVTEFDGRRWAHIKGYTARVVEPGVWIVYDREAGTYSTETPESFAEKYRGIWGEY